jgi:uncharacterized linocin/CFP29 family protein
MAHDSPIPWTEEQWARIEQTIHQEASAARVAAKFLPLYGPLPKDTDFVRAETLDEPPGADTYLTIKDKTTVELATLQVKVRLRGAQLADPELTSALQLFRRAANVLARLEDAVVFTGLQKGANGLEPIGGASSLPGWQIQGEEARDGLWSGAGTPEKDADIPKITNALAGESLVQAVSASILALETQGHFGPFAVVLGHELFNAAETPDADSLVLPQDRIVPFLDGGSLHRSSALDPGNGVVVALGGAPVDLVVATDISLGFLQVTTDPFYVFRVYEKIVLRIKQAKAIGKLQLEGGAKSKVELRTAAGSTSGGGSSGGGSSGGGSSGGGSSGGGSSGGGSSGGGSTDPGS